MALSKYQLGEIDWEELLRSWSFDISLALMFLKWSLLVCRER